MTSARAGETYTTVSGLLFRQWPGEEAAVVYVPQATSTHLVSELAGLVLQAASCRALNAEQIGAALSATMDLAASDTAMDDDFSSQVQAVLDGLVQAGLLHRAR